MSTTRTTNNMTEMDELVEFLSKLSSGADKLKKQQRIMLK